MVVYLRDYVVIIQQTAQLLLFNCVFTVCVRVFSSSQAHFSNTCAKQCCVLVGAIIVVASTDVSAGWRPVWHGVSTWQWMQELSWLLWMLAESPTTASFFSICFLISLSLSKFSLLNLLPYCLVRFSWDLPWSSIILLHCFIFDVAYVCSVIIFC